MLSIVLSTIAFFIASFYIKRWMENNDIPKGFTRSVTIFCLALFISYGVSVIVDKIFPSEEPAIPLLPNITPAP